MTAEPVFAHPPWVYVYIDAATDTHPGFIRIREGGSTGAAVLAIRGTDVLLVEVFRRAVNRTMLEIPRGFGELGESPSETASRELEEETGFRVAASSLTSLGQVAPNGGILESVVELYVAQVQSDAEQTSQPDPEVSSIRWIPVREVLTMASNGGIIDAFTLSALLRAQLHGYLPCQEGLAPHQTGFRL